MNCPKCGTEISSSAKYCGECGTQLTNSMPVPERSLEAWLDDYFARHLKHRDIVEAELTSKISANVRTAMWRFGVPTSLIVFVLAAIGIEHVRDIRTQIDKQRAEVVAMAQNATKEISTAQKDALAKLDALDAEVKRRAVQVRNDVTSFDATKKTIDERQKRIADTQRNIDQLQHKLDGTLYASEEELKKINATIADVNILRDRVANEPYRVLILYPPKAEDAVYQRLQNIRASLAEQGFSVNSTDAVAAPVDKNEVLAFSDEGLKKAEIIRQILLKSGVHTVTRLNLYTARHYDVQLNLKDLSSAAVSVANAAR